MLSIGVHREWECVSIACAAMLVHAMADAALCVPNLFDSMIEVK